MFDARNPPPPNGLGVTAANFGVVSGDTLFQNWPVTTGTAKVCPDANAPPYYATAGYAISPMSAGQYVMQGFFDYTGDFFATFKFRQLPEATDVGGGYIDVLAAQQLFTNGVQVVPADGGLPYYPVQEQQTDPNYLPSFLPVNIGTQGPTPSTSIRSIPSFTMPDNGYLAADVPVTLAATLPLSRPYFYPTGVAPSSITTTIPTPLTPIVSNGSSSDRPAAAPAVKTPANPTGDVDFVPVLSFPQDIAIYAAPNESALTNIKELGNAVQVLEQYQSAFPELKLNAGVPLVEQTVAADTSNVANPFHMQLGLSNPAPGAAPGGNGGIYTWWNACDGLPGCNSGLDDWIPEAPSLVYRMWPLIVLAKLVDLPGGPNPSQPNPNDPEAITAQGSDLTQPIVIIQGITLNGDSFLGTTVEGPVLANPAVPTPLSYPDYASKTNLQDHVTVLVRPSTLCMDPRAPDHGGVLVTPGNIVGGSVNGPYAPLDTQEGATSGAVISSANLSNPQLATLVNHNAAGSTNGLVTGCLPTGRYQINIVYPTGQAWTTPNETGSCAAAEGNTLFTGSGASGSFTDPLVNGCSLVNGPRPVLYSQGTRAVVEITPATNPANCTTYAGGVVPKDTNGNPTPNGIPFACYGLCSDPSLDPTAINAKGIPCSACLDPRYSPTGSPPCTQLIAGGVTPPATSDAGP